jgi:predicted NBD/HSP70 family sugar kinase
MVRKIQPNLLRKLNERAVFDLVRSQGQISRAQLTRMSGISAPTASKVVANLLEAGFLEEVEVQQNDRDVRVGRPSKVYSLGRQTVQVLAATIDVRRCCVLAAGLDGLIDDSQVLEFATPGTYDELIDAMARRARQLMRRRSGIPTLGMGISTPGEIDFDRQRVLLSPNLHMTDGRSPSADLARRLGIETLIFHETIGTCLAERAYGCARGMNDFVMVGVYEGFGASIVSGGRLLEGREKMAGEVGHITVDINGDRCGCGNNGCLETLATDVVFARKITKRLGKRLEVEQVIQMAREKLIDAEPELSTTLEYLAIGIAALVNIFNPEAVLVCSRMLDADPNAFDRLVEFATRRALKPLMRRCRILRAEGNTRQGAVAAIIHHLTHAVGPVLE